VLKTILFVPGFLKTQKDVEQIEQICGKLNEFVNPHGYEVLLSECGKQPSTLGIDDYAMMIAGEVDIYSPDAIIAFSMNTVSLRLLWARAKIKIPQILVEGPNAGTPVWKLLLMLTRFPITRQCIRDIRYSSKAMQVIKKNHPKGPVMEIQGKFSQWWLAKKVYEPLPQTEIYSLFPKIGHRALLTDPLVNKRMLDFLERFTVAEA